MACQITNDNEAAVGRLKNKTTHRQLCLFQLGHENIPLTVHYTSCLIGIVTMVYYNPYIPGKYNLLHTLNNHGAFSLLKWPGSQPTVKHPAMFFHKVETPKKHLLLGNPKPPLIGVCNLYPQRNPLSFWFRPFTAGYPSMTAFIMRMWHDRATFSQQPAAVKFAPGTEVKPQIMKSRIKISSC